MKRKKGDLERITGDVDITNKLDKILVEQSVYSSINQLSPFEKEQVMANGGIDAIVQEGMTNLKTMGKDRYIPIINELFEDDFDVDITISDETINRSVMAKMLQDTIGILSGLGLPINNTLRELYDTLGLDADRLIEEAPQQMPQMPQGMPQAPQGAGAPAQEMPQPSEINA